MNTQVHEGVLSTAPRGLSLTITRRNDLWHAVDSNHTQGSARSLGPALLTYFDKRGVALTPDHRATMLEAAEVIEELFGGAA